jgi:hypothetical protein
LHPNSCHRVFVLHPSACCLRLLSIYLYVHSLDRYWDPRHRAICTNTALSFDPEPARQFIPTLATIRLHCIHQLAIFLFCSFTRTFIRLVDARIRDIVPSLTTLHFRSTRDQCGYGNPICVVLLAPPLLRGTRNYTSQLFICF